MNEMNNEGFALGWDDEFTNEQQEFVLLPEGEYPFEVTQMERARYEGGAKLPPCSMAKLTLRIYGGAHALFAYEHFKEYEHSIVKSPENKVPACAVPKSCAEPNKEKSSVFSSFAEDREIKHIISEK